MLRFSLLLASASLAFAQQYTISTVAGGAPPATPVTATSVTIGQPKRVAVDGAGNVYFSAGHSVFKVNSGGAMSLVAGNSRAGFSGDGGLAVNAQLNTPAGIAVDPAGNIYIADSANNRIRQVSPSGIITTFAGNGRSSPGGPRTYNDGGPATDALLRLPLGVAVDKSGNVLICDTGDNAIRIVTPDGLINLFAGDSFGSFAGDGGNAVDAELNHPSDIALDASGNVFIADTANARIREVTTDGKINSIAGNDSIGYSGDDGPATSATLYAPVSVAFDGSGNLYIAESGDSRVRRIDTKGVIVTVAGTNSIGLAADGSTANKSPLNLPTGVAADGSGNLYIADSLNLRVRKVASGNITTIAGNGGVSYSGDGGPASKAQMNSPQGVAVDAAGNFYISDSNNNVVRKVSANGTITNFAGNGTPGSGGDGSGATSAQLNSPQGLAVDTAGNVYIADTLNARIRKVSTNGSISTVAGNGTPGFGGDGGAATSANLTTPTGVAVDAAGNLYIADFGNNRVRKVSTGGTITTVAGNGISSYSGDGGLAANAAINTPQGVAVDAFGNLYIADAANNVIRKVTPSNIISTVAGNGVAGFFGDGGLATTAQLTSPASVAVDAVGNLYIADGTARIRKIYPTGFIATIAGTGVRGYSGDGGLGTSAQLSSPVAVASDANGNVYVADAANNAVRLLQVAGTGLSIGAVTNGASNLLGAIAPGEVVVLYGSGLGPASLAQFQLDSKGMVPTTVGGTNVIVNGVAAPVIYSSATQVGAVVPFELTGSSAKIFVVNNGQSSAPITVDVAPVSPAIFTLNSSGTGVAAAINKDGSINGPSSPVKGGDYITLYLTGAGQTNPPAQNGKPGNDGSVGNPLGQAILSSSATIGGKPADVLFLGSAPGIVAGVFQLNLTVPAGLTAGAVPVLVNVGTGTTPTGVTIFVTP